MVRSVAADLLELRKRRAVWVLGAILMLAVALFGYAFVYLIIVNRPPNVQITGGSAQELKDNLLPAQLVPYVLSFLPLGLGGAVGLILGAVTAGSEYGWGTLKTLLTQGPSRLHVFGSRLLALGVLLFALVALTFAVAAIASGVIARIEDTGVRWPPLSESVTGLVSAWLILATWAALGVVLAVLFRGTALAVGLGLIYILLVESVVGQFASLASALKPVRDALPGVNAVRLAASFDGGPGRAPGAVAVLAAYVLAFLLLAALVTKRRDVS